MTTGIYKITNLIDGKSYIGQSQNIEERFKEHRYHHNNSDIGRAIYKYGVNNFSFEILEECDVSELDSKEDYYILKFDSINNGYNNIRGGQNNIGESNSNAKLSENEVYYIREAYKNGEDLEKTYQQFCNKISLTTFQNVWYGRIWTHIHMDVYTNKLTRSNNYNNAKISDEIIYDIREDYKNHKNRVQVYQKYEKIVSESYFDKIWNGSVRKDIHMDVYTLENRDYQRRQSISFGSADSIFTDEEVLYYRRKHAYEGIPITELHKEVMNKGKKCLYNTFYDMVRGAYYKRIPRSAVLFKNKNN